MTEPLISEQRRGRPLRLVAVSVAAVAAAVCAVTVASSLYAGSGSAAWRVPGSAWREPEKSLPPWANRNASELNRSKAMEQGREGDINAGTPYTGPRLQFINGCNKDSIWIAGQGLGVALVDPPKKLGAGDIFSVDIPDAGLVATRFWPKWGCDEWGQNCEIGQSGGPKESCPAFGCAPPVDSKFEATFGCMPGTEECAVNPSAPCTDAATGGPDGTWVDPGNPLLNGTCRGGFKTIDAVDWWDVSQVDGWTLPYKVELLGPCDAPRTIDCSELSFDGCPDVEELGPGIEVPTLRLRHPLSKRQTVGCYSPCTKLSTTKWDQGLSFMPESKEARDFCCPTPPISPQNCSTGPVTLTAYVYMVHKLCPSVYAYAYDDGVGLEKCPAGTGYKVTFFCPDYGE